MEDVYNVVKRYEGCKDRFILTGKIRVLGGFFTVRPDNRDLIVKYLDMREEDFRDIYGAGKDARIRNAKTLYKFLTSYLANIAFWFNDKPFTDLTEDDIRRVYRGLESGELKSVKDNHLGELSLKDIYERAMKNGFFKMIGKDELARNVIKRKIANKQEVRFFELDTLKKMADLASTNTQRLAFWLLFDTGIEVSALVQLKKSHFELKQDSETKTEFYTLRIPKDISKKGRRIRNNYIHFTETNELLKKHLTGLEDTDKLFNMQPFALYRALERLNAVHHFKTKPEGKEITTKDFRSSCATYFLQIGWNTDEIKGRLGHSPSSDEIDKYVNYLGLHQNKRREKDLKIDFNNYKEKHEEAVENLRTMQSKLETEQAQREHLEIQMQAKMDALETRFLKTLASLSKDDAKKKLTPELVRKFVEIEKL
ncbi:MAG: site-specific integrase [Nanoarchaeota archaeon]